MGAKSTAARTRPGSRRHRSCDAASHGLIGAGRAGIRPADLVGAVAGETRVLAAALGAIEIADNFSLVDVPEELAEGIVTGMRHATLRGQKVTIRRERAGQLPEPGTRLARRVAEVRHRRGRARA